MDKCEHKPLIGIVAAIFGAFGIYFLIWGFMVQTSNAISWTIWNWSAILCFLIGIFLLGIGKMIKFKMMIHKFPMMKSRR